jgi:hypothetical protein
MKANKDLREGRSDVYYDRLSIPILDMYVFCELSTHAWRLIKF